MASQRCGEVSDPPWLGCEFILSFLCPHSSLSSPGIPCERGNLRKYFKFIQHEPVLKLLHSSVLKHQRSYLINTSNVVIDNFALIGAQLRHGTQSDLLNIFQPACIAIIMMENKS